MENILKTLSDFEITATPAKFEEIFGNHLGQHLWNKFRSYNHSILTLWRQLDIEHSNKLCTYLENIKK